MNADFSHTCEGCEHVVTEPWAKDILSYRCFAPGRCKGRVVGVKRFDPYIPAWCPKLKKKRRNETTSETSSRVRLMANLQAAVAEAVSGTMEERGRGFASDREAWAELKECIERTKQMYTDIEKVHKEMWSAVKDRNEDAFAALSQEFERSSRILAEEWAQTSALAKIAVISEEG